MMRAPDRTRPRPRRIGPGDGALAARAAARACASGIRARSRRKPRRWPSTCRTPQLLAGALDARRARRRRPRAQEPGPAPSDARIAARARRGAPSRHPGAGRARPVRRGARPTARGARLCAEGDRHHRHQRQDDDDRDDGAPGRAQRQRVAAAGNIGPTMLQTLADAIDAGPPSALRERLPEVWVLELSSFQLAGAASGFDPTPPRCSTSAKTTSTGTARCAAYAAAKARVFGSARDDRRQPRRRRRDALVPAPKALPTRKGRAPKPSRAASSASAPARRSAPATGGCARERHGLARARPRRDETQAAARAGERRRSST